MTRLVGLPAGERYRPGVVVAGCMIGLSVSVGPAFLSTFPVFMTAISQSLGMTRGDVSIAFAASNLAVVLAAPVVGGLVKRIGSTKTIAIGASAFGAALVLLSHVPASLAWLIVSFFLVGVIGTTTHTFVYLSVIPQWIHARLGMIFGVTMTGVGLGQVVMPILADRLINAWGWRGAYTGLAIAVITVTLASVLFLIRERRSHSGSIIVGGGSVGVSAAAAMRQPVFWLLGLSFTLIAGVASGILVHLVAMLVDRGMTRSGATYVLATTGAWVALSRLVGGYLLDRWGGFPVAVAVYVLGVLGVGLTITASAPPAMMAIPVLLGIVMGVEGDLMPYLTRAIFGEVDYPQIYSRLFSFYSIGILCGPLLMGLTFDRTGSYHFGLVICLTCGVIAVTALILAWRRSLSDRSNI